jgi:branched-chain amino acid transport system ATP-binding protein
VSLLEVKDLRVSYGSIEAIKGISLVVEEGQVVTLIGTNGAGKTTTLRTLSGLLKPTAGEIYFDGQRLDGTAAHEVVMRGIAHSPEGRRIFPLMTVEENLELGAYSRKGMSPAEDIKKVFERFPRLEERRGQKAGTLSGGEQQMLAIGRALMSRPRLLMLDEPAAGLNPRETAELSAFLKSATSGELTLLVVEHDMAFVHDLCEHTVVLNFGRLIYDGPTQGVRSDAAVREAYLGTRGAPVEGAGCAA